MYLALNRFAVPVENAASFEEMWLKSESRLTEQESFR